MERIIPFMLAALLIVSAVGHIVNQEFYAEMIPNFIPASFANVLAAIVEVGIGILLIWPKFKYLGGLGFMVLMIVFLPIHIWDLFKENPAIGPAPAPVIRLLLQCLLIYAGWWIYKKFKPAQKP